MIDKTFINLPVKNLERSMNFFKNLGFDFNMNYTDENATSMVVNQNTYVMLLVEDFFNSFTKKKIGDTKNSSEVIMALQVESKEKVDELAAKVVENGSTITEEFNDPVWMYGIRFEDLDGHFWEILYMDEIAAGKQ